MTKSMSNSVLVQDMNDRFVDNSTVDAAAALFIQHIIENRNISSVSHMCAKDPRNLMHMQYLHRLFPSAKFVFMVRDARAAVYSYMSRELPRENGHFFRRRLLGNITEFLLDWDASNSEMDRQCRRLGDEFCIQIRYEQLVSHRQSILMSLVKFLNISWADEMLMHQVYVNKRIKTSKLEWSTKDIMQGFAFAFAAKYF
jgi:protein-tyrosine sulfotransferase